MHGEKGSSHLGVEVKRHRVTRRRMVQTLSAGLGAVAIGQPLWARSSVAAQDPPATPADSPDLEPRPGAGAQVTDTIFWSWASSPNGLDPDFSSNIPSREAQINVCELPLTYGTRRISDTQLAPDFGVLESTVIEDWETPETAPTELTFSFREGIMSHAGNELTADDFIYKLKRGEAVQGISWGFFNRMGIVKSEQVQKLGKYTIKITLEEPNALFLPLLANQALVLYDSVEAQKHATDDDPWATKWMANTLVAHGPWKVESFSPGRETVFARHEDYFGAKPSVQKIVAKEIPASANRLALLLAGAIDVATDLLPIEMQNAGQAPGVRLDSWEANLFDFIGMNAHSGPFSDVRVRQAVSWAIPYDEIQQTVYLGTASQLKSLIPSIFPCYQPEFWQYTFDPEKARSMLGDAGYPDGFSTKIQIDAADPVAELIAIVTGAALEQAGVTAAIEKLPTGDFYALFNGGYEGLWIIRDGPGTYDVSWPPVVWAQTGGLANSGRYSNPDLDEVIEKLRQPGPEQERCKLAEEVQRIVVQEDPIWLFVGAPGYNLGVGSNVKDAMWHLTGGSRWQHMQKF